ncbi:hypothetical protein [Micromonospora sp. NBC_00858]|uniref:hypothetical protein n=1 Tax=Micromonospora sp. NBC_00858 TaxID=2975979 RepID=UPI00386EF005|nr:Imm10 family immunity protein [Micromonospora sp. NBC_00858]
MGEDEDFVYVIGLRESTDPESWSLLFMEPDDEDLEEADDEDLEEADLGTYCLLVDPGQATHHGGVIECEITETRLRLKLTTEAARDLAMPTDVTFTPPSDLAGRQIASTPGLQPHSLRRTGRLVRRPPGQPLSHSG